MPATGTLFDELHNLYLKRVKEVEEKAGYSLDEEAKLKIKERLAKKNGINYEGQF